MIQNQTRTSDPVTPEENDSTCLPGQIRSIPCNFCGGSSFTRLFEKASSRGEVYQIVKCRCGLVQVNPQPDSRRVQPYYSSIYFQKRSDRGYDNYFSETLKSEIIRVYKLNLKEVGFYDYESHLFAGVEEKNEITNRFLPRALDIGCAAGYFVEYLQLRGWESTGIEISAAAAGYGIDELGLNIIIDDFLSCELLTPDSFDLVSLFASLEHMHDPGLVLKRAREILRPGGRMILTTCRHGFLARLRGKKWRYMNVPEHLYFFSLPGLIALAHKTGFEIESAISYGSGLTAKKNSGFLYRTMKRQADYTVKLFNIGDMMALHLKKI